MKPGSEYHNVVLASRAALHETVEWPELKVIPVDDRRKGGHLSSCDQAKLLSLIEGGTFDPGTKEIYKQRFIEADDTTLFDFLRQFQDLLYGCLVKLVSIGNGEHGSGEPGKLSLC